MCMWKVYGGILLFFGVSGFVCLWIGLDDLRCFGGFILSAIVYAATFYLAWLDSDNLFK